MTGIAVAATTIFATLVLAASASALPVVTGVGGYEPFKNGESGYGSVAIHGENLAGATGVSASGVPAESFTVVSPTEVHSQLTPADGTVVDVTVTGPSGASQITPQDRYLFHPFQPHWRIDGGEPLVEGAAYSTLRWGTLTLAASGGTPATCNVFGVGSVGQDLVEGYESAFKPGEGRLRGLGSFDCSQASCPAGPKLWADSEAPHFGESLPWNGKLRRAGNAIYDDQQVHLVVECEASGEVSKCDALTAPAKVENGTQIGGPLTTKLRYAQAALECSTNGGPVVAGTLTGSVHLVTYEGEEVVNAKLAAR